MQANCKGILFLLQFAFAISEELGNCQEPRLQSQKWPPGIFELCSKNDGLCSTCPLNYLKCLKKEKNKPGQEVCLVCMNRDKAKNHHLKGVYHIHNCSEISGTRSFIDF